LMHKDFKMLASTV